MLLARPPDPRRGWRRGACFVTQHPQASDLIHEQGRHDVPRQYSQSAQETDEVYHVCIVLVTEVQQAALFILQESAVDELAVDQAVLEEIWNEERGSIVLDCSELPFRWAFTGKCKLKWLVKRNKRQE